MKSLKFTPELVKLIKEGEKTTTFRLFDDKDLKEGDIIELVEKENGNAFAQAILTNVYEKPIQDLNDDDYDGHEKYESRDKILAEFRKYYGEGVTPMTLVKIIRFRVIQTFYGDENKEIETSWKQIKDTNGDERKQLFIKYCLRLIELKESDKLIAEDVGYKIVAAIFFDNLSEDPILESIFDIAAELEIPRETSYKQAMGHWDKKTADILKEREYQELKKVVEEVVHKI